MYTEEELLEAVDILIEDYGYDEDEAIDLVSEELYDLLITEGEKWEYAKELSSEYAKGSSKGRAAAAIGTAAGIGLGAAAIGANQLRKDLKQSRRNRKNLEHIKKTGRRLSESKEFGKKVARTAGVAMGAYGVVKTADPVVRYAARKLKQKSSEHDEKVRARNYEKEQNAILEYRKNKIKKALKRNK